jgi:hypothetical protein
MENKKYAWWNKKWGKEEICCICQGRLRPAYKNPKSKNNFPKVVSLPNCTHRLHFTCYDKLAKKIDKLQCPMCRAEF